MKKSYFDSLLGKFALISVLIFLFFVLNLLVTYRDYRDQFTKEILNTTSQFAIENIEQGFSYSLDKTWSLSGLIVAQCQPSDLQCIHKLLVIFSDDKKVDAILSWSGIGWVGSDFVARTDNSTPKILPPIDLSKRLYLQKTKEMPNQIMFGDLTEGYISKRLVLPAGFGVTKDGQYIGSISIGFDFAKLVQQLQKLMPKNLTFFIVDKLRNKIVYHSVTGHQEGPEDLKIIKSLELNRYDENLYNISGNLCLLRNLGDTQLSLVISSNKISHSILIQQFIKTHISELSLLCAVLIACLVIFYSYFIRPLMWLSDLAYQISQGNTSNKVLKYSSREIIRIFDTLNNISSYIDREKKLIIDLTITQSKLRSFNIDLENKIKERTVELERALDVKTEFLNNISHEIRTPILGFYSISEGLIEHWDTLDESKKLELANQIAINAKRLTSLLGSILDLAKYNQGKMIIHPVEVDLNHCIEEIVAEAKILYVTNNSINFVVDLDSNVTIMADGDRINQLLRNIVVNAIKYGIAGEIGISLKRSQMILENDLTVAAVHITVNDQGVGIPEKELETIFDPFTQSSLTKTKAGGTGLGLAIAAEIVRVHHGRIWAENKEDHKGAIFNILLPLIPGEAKTDGLSNNSALLTNKTILMIDDEESSLISMEIILHGTQYHLIKMREASKALDYLLGHHQVDLILLDLMMPGMDGLTFISKLREQVIDIPVIMQTGVSDQALIDKAYKLGITHYIQKPYNKKELIKLVSEILK